ncbi:hypothetical protein GDO86_020231 [Hymenochirus boettgeri]|uniref:Profilin n=1 Tax=Hymenochirus boettgeri TaxID=247094 RepID=A0A8T2IKG2_9PIPI|nr:hypothetical protein GDO86_020231 [Hymenochirus boettgeri]
MSWSDYITNLMDVKCEDAAIVGFNPPCLWASRPGGFLEKITPEEIKVFVLPDRSNLFVKGVTLGGMKCSVIRDEFDTPDVHCMDLKTKNPDGPKLNVTVAKTNTALIIVVAADGIHGSHCNSKAHSLCVYLRKQNF